MITLWLVLFSAEAHGKAWENAQALGWCYWGRHSDPSGVTSLQKGSAIDLLLYYILKLTAIGGFCKENVDCIPNFIPRICHQRPFSPVSETEHKYLKISVSLQRNRWVFGHLLNGLIPGEGALAWSFLVQSEDWTEAGYGFIVSQGPITGDHSQVGTVSFEAFFLFVCST